MEGAGVLNSLSVSLQNRIRKNKQKDIPNLRLLKPGEGPHIPTTNYCGPKTNLQDASKYGSTSDVDNVCKLHDLDYNYVDQERDNLTDQEKYDLITTADKRMLDKLDTLPSSTEKTLAYAGIKAKNIAENVSGRLLYGGTVLEAQAIGGCGYSTRRCPKCGYVDGGEISLTKISLTEDEARKLLMKSMGETISTELLYRFDHEPLFRQEIMINPDKIQDIILKFRERNITQTIKLLADHEIKIEKLGLEYKNLDGRKAQNKNKTPAEINANTQRRLDIKFEIEELTKALDKAKASAKVKYKNLDDEISSYRKGYSNDYNITDEVNKILNDAKKAAKPSIVVQTPSKPDTPSSTTTIPLPDETTKPPLPPIEENKPNVVEDKPIEYYYFNITPIFSTSSTKQVKLEPDMKVEHLKAILEKANVYYRRKSTKGELAQIINDNKIRK